ncbi:MAG: hypothetical protein AUJ98_09540 [Bacteroidetes bacterium CG2_30_33_31]|nr:MAG: hypothetical protein AUJ98_09540 [Bacteroidetes bacterium CG2_30_33_31]
MDNIKNLDKNILSKDDLLEIFSSVWENSPDALLLLDSDGGIIKFNLAFADMFRINPEIEYKNKFVYDLLVNEYKKKAILDFLYAATNGEIKNCEYQVIRHDNSIFPINISFRRVNFKNHQGDYFILIGRDITKNKIDERALRNAKDKAEIADKLKTSFLANMSHEIRTPINAVIGFADLLNDSDLLDEERKEYINTIQVNGELLLNLINDIIDIAKIESGQLKISKNEFSIKQLFDEIYLSARNALSMLEKPQIILEYKIEDSLEDVFLVTDQYRLMQIINNLLNNAIKFTDKGRIDFGVGINKNDKIEFYVKDTGIGISEKDVDIIFDRFGQVEEALVRNVGGTGLGLSITKSLVEILGGRIKVKSTVEEGSTFIFTIDAERKSGQLNPSIQKIVNLKGKKILIVEDTESNYRLLNILLSKYGAETIWALTGKQGVSICRNSNDLDLVLMDINLPDIDGYEATSQIKSFKPNLPIVAQTAYAMAGEREKSLEFGCDDYISKPINPEKLFSIIIKLTV